MYYDFHVHSDFSSDSHTPMETMIQQGIRLGLPGLCFTEHMDLDFPGEELSFLTDLPSYKEKFLELKERYQGQIELFYGPELGMQPHLLKELPALADSDNFDFLIGSAHIIDRMDPYDKLYFQGRSEQESYLRYFDFWRTSKPFPVLTPAVMWIMWFDTVQIQTDFILILLTVTSWMRF